MARSEGPGPREVPVPRPRDADGVGIAIVGTVLWAIAALTLVTAGDAITSALPALDLGMARSICLAGTALGLLGIAVLLVRRHRRRASALRQE